MNFSGLRIVLAGHGSRDAAGTEEFESFAELFRQTCEGAVVRHGYLEFNEPTLEAAIAEITEHAEGPIVVVPALLAAATHAKNDMPSLIKRLREQFPDEDIHFAAVMDLHSTLLQICSRRIAQAEAASANMVKRSQTCLVVVGRGTSDPDANGDIAKLTRLLEEGLAFGGSFTCYSGTASPLVADGLQTATKLGYPRMIVLPYFLFDGVLVKRIYAAADKLQQRHPQIEVLKANYLGVDKDLAHVLAERAYEAVFGKPNMNCGLCKYRAPMPGYENEVGSPQRPHREVFIPKTYVAHPIEAESFRIIQETIDWSSVPSEQRPVLMRLVHTTGDASSIKDMFFSPGAIDIGIRALLRCRRVVTDVTMVQTGLKRALLQQLGIDTWCSVHDPQTAVLAAAQNLTRSAAGMRRAWQMFGNDMVIAIGDAPTAVLEVVRLVREHGFRPQLVVGIPVGFVGTSESKDQLRSCLQIPRITNIGTKGGSPWAATIINALLIEAVNRCATPDATTNVSAGTEALPTCRN